MQITTFSKARERGTMKQTDHWNAQLYDGSHAYVSKFGTNLIELLAPKKGEHILDAGCGTGDLAGQITEHGATVIGIDSSENMIRKAKEKFPHLTFSVQDVLTMSYQNEFDAVFSNAVLHWIKQPDEALRRIYQSLKTGGRFVAEFGGKGNVKTITDELFYQLKQLGMEYNDEQFPWYFPSIGEYASLMEKTGFRVVYAEHFDRPTMLAGENGLRNWLEMFAKSIIDELEEETKEKIIAKVEERLKDKLYTQGRWIADYKRIRVIGRKE